MNIKTLFTLLFAGFTTLALTTFSYSQSLSSSEIIKQAENQRKAQEKLEKLKKKINDKAKIEIQKGYDKFKDSTSVHLDFMPVLAPEIYDGRDTHFYVDASCRYDGSNPQAKYYSMAFVSKELNGLRFRDNRNLIMLIDGERMILGIPSWEGQVNPIRFLGEIINISNEVMIIDVPASVFAKMANARTIEFQLGRVEGIFTEKHIAGFRALIENASN